MLIDCVVWKTLEHSARALRGNLFIRVRIIPVKNVTHYIFTVPECWGLVKALLIMISSCRGNSIQGKSPY